MSGDSTTANMERRKARPLSPFFSDVYLFGDLGDSDNKDDSLVAGFNRRQRSRGDRFPDAAVLGPTAENRARPRRVSFPDHFGRTFNAPPRERYPTPHCSPRAFRRSMQKAASASSRAIAFRYR